VSKKNRLRTRVAPYVFLHIASLILVALVVASRWPLRTYWIIGLIALTLAVLLVMINRERLVMRAQDQAVIAKTNLAVSVFQGGQALIAALGQATSAPDFEKCQSAVRVLIDRVLRLAHAELGRQVETKVETRATFYQLFGNNLVLSVSIGSTGNTPPRPIFEFGRSKYDTAVIRFARGEDSVLVTDTQSDLPSYLEVIQGRGYRSFLAVPVSAGPQSFGLLTVDSNKPNILTEIDEGLLVLMAGMLGMGLFQLDAKKRASLSISESDKPLSGTG
jgi:GAF domain-containing protein